MFAMDTVVNFSCEVWSPKPVEVRWLFEACDLRKLGDCGRGNLRQEGVSKSFAIPHCLSMNLICYVCAIMIKISFSLAP
jgi:hypothetical protein